MNLNFNVRSIPTKIVLVRLVWQLADELGGCNDFVREPDLPKDNFLIIETCLKMKRFAMISSSHIREIRFLFLSLLIRKTSLDCKIRVSSQYESESNNFERVIKFMTDLTEVRKKYDGFFKDQEFVIMYCGRLTEMTNHEIA